MEGFFMTITKEIKYVAGVEVTVDETKFTEEWLADFRSFMYNFHTIDQHLEHLGQMYARGFIDDLPGCFIEGYGDTEELGIKFRKIYEDVEIL